MANQYTRDNDLFTRRAHRAAIEPVYMDFLPYDSILIDLQGTDRDMNNDEDFELRAWHPQLDSPICFGIQERFRRAEYSHYREVTIADRDLLRKEDKQVYNTDAEFIVFGYYNDKEDRLLETIVVDQALLRWLIVRMKVPFQRQKHGSKEISFISVGFDDLIEHDADIFHYQP